MIKKKINVPNILDPLLNLISINNDIIVSDNSIIYDLENLKKQIINLIEKYKKETQKTTTKSKGKGKKSKKLSSILRNRKDLLAKLLISDIKDDEKQIVENIIFVLYVLTGSSQKHVVTPKEECTNRNFWI